MPGWTLDQAPFAQPCHEGGTVQVPGLRVDGMEYNTVRVHGGFTDQYGEGRWRMLSGGEMS